MLFLDYYQASQIGASRTRDRTPSTDARLNELERRIDRIALACQALWELLQEQNSIPEEKVFEKMEEIDLRDGRADGRISDSILECKACKRKVNSRRAACMYCGEPNPSHNIVS